MDPNDPHLDISSICGCWNFFDLFLDLSHIHLFGQGQVFIRGLEARNSEALVGVDWEKVKKSSGKFVYLFSKALKPVNFKYQIDILTLYFPHARRLK